MPLVKGTGETEEEILRSRIRNAQRMLKTAALIMSVMLIGSAVVTTTMIPAADFKTGGPADGRALAYLAHRDLGEVFGTSTICRRSRSSGLPARQRWRAC